MKIPRKARKKSYKRVLVNSFMWRPLRKRSCTIAHVCDYGEPQLYREIGFCIKHESWTCTAPDNALFKEHHDLVAWWEYLREHYPRRKQSVYLQVKHGFPEPRKVMNA